MGNVGLGFSRALSRRFSRVGIHPLRPHSPLQIGDDTIYDTIIGVRCTCKEAINSLLVSNNVLSQFDIQRSGYELPTLSKIWAKMGLRTGPLPPLRWYGFPSLRPYRSTHSRYLPAEGARSICSAMGFMLSTMNMMCSSRSIPSSSAPF
jgi:hypothetical protein